MLARENPATGDATGAMHAATASQVAEAVDAARKSFDAGVWARASHGERRAALRAAAVAIRGDAEALRDEQVRETGMIPGAVARQVSAAADWFDYYADFLGIEGGAMHRQLGNATALVEREPIGVCALFSPWNVPLALSAIKLAPALAAGNSVILKPSEMAPGSVRMLVDLVQSSGLPDGVLNCVNGRGATTGAALSNAEGVDMISFTGGSAGGLAVAEAAARRHIPCVMELGGKSANLVFDDADIDAALEGSLAAIFGSNGKACLAGSRILLQAGIADAFRARFVERANAMRVGDPREPRVEMGPMVSAAHRDRVLGFYASAEADGDTVLCGGAYGRDGCFVRPGAILAASTGSRIWQEEVFGPVAAFMRFRTEVEAIPLANDSRYGLVGFVWSRDLDRATWVARGFRAGTVIINDSFRRELNAPFGGYKASGVGREGGSHSWRNFTEAKTTILRYG